MPIASSNKYSPYRLELLPSIPAFHRRARRKTSLSKGELVYYGPMPSYYGIGEVTRVVGHYVAVDFRGTGHFGVHDYRQYDVYTLDLSKSTAQRITYNAIWDDQSAKFGEDPNKLLFISDRNGIHNLYEKDLVTDQIRPLTDAVSGITQVALSANGEVAMLVSQREGRPIIFKMNDPFLRELESDKLKPSVWAQRVSQETIDPAPAIAVAPPSTRKSNPFLRDATDGIAYARQPNSGGALLANRLMDP